MPYRDIQRPVVGDKQMLLVNGSENLIDLPTYLGYMNENYQRIHGNTPIRVNGVVGETMSVAIATTANAIPEFGEIIFMQPVVFPTAGTIQQTLITGDRPENLHVMLQGTMTCVTAQAGVLPAIGLQVEFFNRGGSGQTSNGLTGIWQKINRYQPSKFYTFMSGVGGTAGAVVSLSYYQIITDTLPNTQYRFTALAGIYSSIALPHTGQWKIDAVGTNTLEFNSWVGG